MIMALTWLWYHCVLIQRMELQEYANLFPLTSPPSSNWHWPPFSSLSLLLYASCNWGTLALHLTMCLMDVIFNDIKNTGEMDYTKLYLTKLSAEPQQSLATVYSLFGQLYKEAVWKNKDCRRMSSLQINSLKSLWKISKRNTEILVVHTKKTGHYINLLHLPCILFNHKQNLSSTFP